ncbi:MAG: hypothetical protein CMH60_05205 [Myxococcales bacterium]|nr:hypothetical protein [Myxococcales bacterium]
MRVAPYLNKRMFIAIIFTSPAVAILQSNPFEFGWRCSVLLCVQCFQEAGVGTRITGFAGVLRSCDQIEMPVYQCYAKSS